MDREAEIQQRIDEVLAALRRQQATLIDLLEAPAARQAVLPRRGLRFGFDAWLRHVQADPPVGVEEEPLAVAG